MILAAVDTTLSAPDNARTAHTARTTARVARYLPHTARFLLGACFFVFGLNGFLSFIPPPPGPQPEGAMALGMAMMQSGYLFPLIKGTEVVAGALLLANRFVPLALALLAPVIVNIVLFHAVLAPEGTSMGVATLVLELYLAWAHRHAFAPMLAARVSPR